MLALGLALMTFAVADLLTGGLAAAPRAGRWKQQAVFTLLPSLAAAFAYGLNTGDARNGAAFFTVLWLGSLTWVLGRASARRVGEIVALQPKFSYRQVVFSPCLAAGAQC